MSSDFVRPVSRSPMCEALFKAIRLALESDRTKMYTNLVLYTSFGIVRGRVKRDDMGSYDGRVENISRARLETDVLELHDAQVDTLSTTLPTAQYDRFYLRAEDITGFAFDKPPEQFTVNI